MLFMRVASKIDDRIVPATARVCIIRKQINVELNRRGSCGTNTKRNRVVGWQIDVN